MLKVRQRVFSLIPNTILTITPDVARFTNIKLEQCQGEIYVLCKDQHGCRFLQKQLETQIPENVHLIFLETNQHVVELMTGNPLLFYTLQVANHCRPFWELSLPETFRVLE